MSTKRIEGVDVARGIASLIMIQGHAYDGWVRTEEKTSAAYLFTRLLGSFPLPAFLVLAGAAIVLRTEAASRRNETATTVRRAILRRGATVIVYGYLASLAYACMDGFDGFETLFRADVLQVIGLSICAFAWLGIRGATHPQRKTMMRAALVLWLLPTALCPWLSPLGASIDGPLRFAVALLVDVPHITLMPFIPLVSWLAMGAVGCLAMLHARERQNEHLSAGASTQTLLAFSVLSLILVILGHQLMQQLLQTSNDPLSRAHVAVWGNVLDLGGRGLLILFGGALLSRFIPNALKQILIRVGQGSLVAYIFHIPFCYGWLGTPWRGQLTMGEATLGVALLMLISILVVYARDAWRVWRQPRPSIA